MGLREDKGRLVGLIFLLGLPLNTETPTIEMVGWTGRYKNGSQDWFRKQ